MPDYYTHADVQQILKQASAFQDDTVSRQQLLEIASEAGIAEEALHKGEQQWLRQQQVEQQQSIQRSRRRLGFKLHLIPYLVISIFLIGLNLKTTPRYFCSVFPVSGWGLGVIMHGVCIHKKEQMARQTFLP